MTTKKVLLTLAATSLFALGYTAPVWAEDPPPASTVPVPADPDSAETGDIAPDAGTDEGAAGDAAGAEPGTEGGEPPPQPE